MARKLISLTVLAFFTMAWTSLSSAQESTYDVVKKRGTLVAGVKNDYPPFGFVDADGKWVGIEVDMSKYIADKLGVALKMEPVTSRTRIPLLVNGNVDIIMNINPTRERAKVVDFTRPWFQDGSTLLVYRGSGIQSVKDVAAPRKTGAAQGSANAAQVLALQPKADIVYFQEYPQGFLALKQKRVDSLTAGTITLLQLAKNSPELEVLSPPFNPDPSAIGVRYNDSKWRLAIEEIIMDAWADGTIAKLHEKFVGSPVTFKVELWPDYPQK